MVVVAVQGAHLRLAIILSTQYDYIMISYYAYKAQPQPQTSTEPNRP